jgi:hypothetical protein
LSSGFYKSGEGPATQPASRNLEDITARGLTSTFGANPSREKLRVTRFPVSISEFSQLKSKAEKAKPAGARRAEQSLVQEVRADTRKSI